MGLLQYLALVCRTFPGELVGQAIRGYLVGVARRQLLGGLAEYTCECLQVEVYGVEFVENGLTLTRQRGVLEGGELQICERAVVHGWGDGNPNGFELGRRKAVPYEPNSISILLIVKVHRNNIRFSFISVERINPFSYTLNIPTRQIPCSYLVTLFTYQFLIPVIPKYLSSMAIDSSFVESSLSSLRQRLAAF